MARARAAQQACEQGHVSGRPRSRARPGDLRAEVGLMSSSNNARQGGGHARWERTGAQRHDAAYAEARAALLLARLAEAIDAELDIAFRPHHVAA